MTKYNEHAYEKDNPELKQIQTNTKRNAWITIPGSFRTFYNENTILKNIKLNSPQNKLTTGKYMQQSQRSTM